MLPVVVVVVIDIQGLCILDDHELRKPLNVSSEETCEPSNI